MAHWASERSLAYGFMGKNLLTFHFFCLGLLLFYHISPFSLLLFKRLPWPFRTASKSNDRSMAAIAISSCIREAWAILFQFATRLRCVHPTQTHAQSPGWGIH